tara:strand:+ start:165 stop:1124 length:960 start_codon:yes stop_codon:yes gene_type:complete
MEQQEEWNKVDTEKKEESKVEFEVEKEEEVKEEPKEEKEVKEEKKEEPKELEGIDTKGAQKRIRQLVKQRKEKEEEVARLIRQNEELAHRVQKQEQDFFKLGKLNLSANEKQIKDKLELARTAYATAHEEGNSEKILKAQEALNEAQVDLKNIEATKTNFKEPEVQQQAVQQQVQQPQPQPDPRAEEWAAQNEWFGKDRIMTASALAIDTELKEEGYDSTSAEFYEEITKRLHENFPHKFKDGTTEKKEIRKQESTPAQVVAGGTRSTPSSKNKVKLSKDDVRLAEKWNIPLEQYAQEKLKATNAEGEYTTVNMQRGGK